MWDAWAAYDRTADGYFSREKQRAADVQAARETAISYAAYRILLWRYAQATGLQTTFDALTATMRSLCLSPGFASTKGDSPAALGNRIAARRDQGGARRRLAGGAALRGHELPVGERAAGRREGRHDDARPDLLAAARARPDRRPERDRRSRAGCSRSSALSGATCAASRCHASKKGLPIDPGKPPFGTPETAAYKQAGGRGDPRERRARLERPDDDRHRSGRARRQPARHATAATATTSIR